MKRLIAMLVLSMMGALLSGCGPARASEDAVGVRRQSIVWLGTGWEPSPSVQSEIDDANAGASAQSVWAHGYDYALDNEEELVDDILEAVQGLQDWSGYDWTSEGEMSVAQANQELQPYFDQLIPVMHDWLAQPIEPTRVGYLRTRYPVAPGADAWLTLYVFIYPESMNIVVLAREIVET